LSIIHEYLKSDGVQKDSYTKVKKVLLAPDCETRKLLPGKAIDAPNEVFLDSPTNFSILREHELDEDGKTWSKVCKVGYEIIGTIPSYVTLDGDKIRVAPYLLS
jgi:hypothetical protein